MTKINPSQTQAEEKIIPPPPKTAEAKALQRIQALEAGEKIDWITTIQEGDLIDDETLDKWLKKRGYSGEV